MLTSMGARGGRGAFLPTTLGPLLAVLPEA